MSNRFVFRETKVCKNGQEIVSKGIGERYHSILDVATKRGYSYNITEPYKQKQM